MHMLQCQQRVSRADRSRNQVPLLKLCVAVVLQAMVPEPPQPIVYGDDKVAMQCMERAFAGSLIAAAAAAAATVGATVAALIALS